MSSQHTSNEKMKRLQGAVSLLSLQNINESVFNTDDETSEVAWKQSMPIENPGTSDSIDVFFSEIIA